MNLRPHVAARVVGSARRRLHAWQLCALLACGAATVTTAAACGTSAPAKPFCTPDKDFFCRCSNPLEEGIKTCNAEGTAYGPCLPCVLSEPEGDSGPEPDAAELCGNGRIDVGENCDDGNRNNNDLCSDLCVPQGNPSGACPALPVYLWDSFELADATKATSSFQTTTNCGGASGSTSPERVYEITPALSGTLVVSVRAATFDSMVYARRDCTNVATERVCTNTAVGNGDEVATLAVVAKTKLWVVVDGVRQSSGNFSVKFELIPQATADAGTDANGDARVDARSDAKRD